MKIFKGIRIAEEDYKIVKKEAEKQKRTIKTILHLAIENYLKVIK